MRQVACPGDQLTGPGGQAVLVTAVNMDLVRRDVLYQLRTGAGMLEVCGSTALLQRFGPLRSAFNCRGMHVYLGNLVFTNHGERERYCVVGIYLISPPAPLPSDGVPVALLVTARGDYRVLAVDSLLPETSSVDHLDLEPAFAIAEEYERARRDKCGQRQSAEDSSRCRGRR